MKVLVIDCYDSFTYNLCQIVGSQGCTPVVVKSDEDPRMLEGIEPDRIILSPGPGRPEDSGLSLHVIKTLSREIPTLGVCLGHQAICFISGGKVVQGTHLMHGKTSQISHHGRGLYHGIKNPFPATRYHSLIAERDSLPETLEVTATSLDDNYVMGVRHRDYPMEGIQFHPESILCSEGPRLLGNFLKNGVRSQ
ncbi:MAG TPA: aminodeoxychorismate/anthranilate synthase component II [Methanoregulaceae archaeon]|nr:aminodeoxychorismate/anthranilate synthase component II [Methanoregulaceae archaeon]